MKYIVDKIIRIIDEQNSLYSEVDILKMRLGFEILIHNILMVGTILIIAFVCDIFYESVVLLFVYGLLKLNAGGIHCKTSSGCLIATLVFVLGGVYMGKKLDIDLLATVIIYDFCTVVLYFIAPQGTSNNPVSKENYSRLKMNTVIICIV